MLGTNPKTMIASPHIVMVIKMIILAPFFATSCPNNIEPKTPIRDAIVAIDNRAAVSHPWTALNAPFHTFIPDVVNAPKIKKVRIE